jgi:hypothetical protein
MWKKLFKVIVDITIAALLFSSAFFDISWLPQPMQDLLIEKINEQKPSEDTPTLIYWVLLAYSTAAFAQLLKFEFRWLQVLVKRKGAELKGTLLAAIGVILAITIYEHVNGREGAILLGAVLMVAYAIFLYAPIWIGNQLLDAVDLSEKTAEQALSEGVSRLAQPKKVRLGVAFVLNGLVLIGTIYGLCIEYLG